MNSPLMLVGNVDDRDQQIASLREQVADLEQQLEMAQAETAEAKRQAGVVVRELRRQLGPLHQALRMLFGELDRIPDSGSGTPVASGDKGSKWESVKRNMPPRHQQAIDVLLLQGTMKRTQIASALKMDYANCAKNVITILIRQGWIVDNGGNLSLKEL